MRLVSLVSLGVFALGCQVDMAPGMLQGSLFEELRTGQVVSALCSRPFTDDEVTRVSTELKVDQIAATRGLFGSEGHGTAHVEFKPEQGARCSGSVEFDFKQDSKVARKFKRSVQHTNSFAYSNVVVKH